MSDHRPTTPAVTRADVLAAFTHHGMTLAVERTGGHCEALVWRGPHRTVAVTAGDPDTPRGTQPWPHVVVSVFRPRAWTGDDDDNDPDTVLIGTDPADVAHRTRAALTETPGPSPDPHR